MAILKPMLAAKFEDFLPRINSSTFPLYAQPKLDGIRCTIQGGLPISRSGKLIPNTHVQNMVKQLDASYEFFDGELMVGDWSAPDVYNTTQSGIMSQGGEPDFTYAVFDWISDFDYEHRLYELQRFFDFVQHPQVKMVHSRLLLNMDELEQYEAEQLALGYEGIVLRGLKTFYKHGRATALQGQLIKVKRFEDAEATVIGFEEKMHNANEAFKSELGFQKRSSHQENMIPQNTLGALQATTFFDGRVVEISVGSGFDDATRQKIWDNRGAYLGNTFTYKFQRHGSKDKPRIPIFKGFRHKDDIG